MEELNEKGYPKRIKMIIETKNKNISAKYLNFGNSGNQNISINIEKLIDNLEDLFEQQKNSLIKVCKKKPLMRFFYGKQFFLLSKYIDIFKLNIIDADIKKENIVIYRKKLISLLINITGIDYFDESDNSIENLKKIVQNNQMNDIERNLAKISQYLEILFNVNNLTVEKILTPNIIKNNNYHGFYTVEVLEKSYEIEILNWYYRLTKNLPLSLTLLFCNEETSDEELISFIYRAIFCEYNVLFLIQNIEDLPDNKRKKIITILSNENIENLQSTLVITYKRQDSDIYKSMMKIRGIKRLDEYKNRKMNNKIEFKSFLIFIKL